MAITDNLKRYFSQLSIMPTTASLDLVDELCRKHIAEFSFNNIAVLLGEEISLDIEDIYKKVVVENRGGYCYEHNRLMFDALQQLGFNVQLLLARVLNNQPIDAPRTHRITLLTWKDEQYLVDVGFGPKCLHRPIKIADKSESIQDGIQFQIEKKDNDTYYFGQIIEDEFYVLYTFELNQYTEADCLVGNFYSHNHPNAVFRNNLVISRILSNMTLSLINKAYHKISEAGTEIIEINSASQLREIITKDFEIGCDENESEQLFNLQDPKNK